MDPGVGAATIKLKGEYKKLHKEPCTGFSVGLVDEDNIFEWNITVLGPPDTYYESGIFSARMKFPANYPMQPPELRFVSEIWHPNVYPDGRVCISILHPPGEDAMGYESASERWSPAQTVESVMISIISLLADPNDESPANPDAAKQWREDKKAYKRRVLRCVEKSFG